MPQLRLDEGHRLRGALLALASTLGFGLMQVSSAMSGAQIGIAEQAFFRNLIGLVDGIKEPTKVERELWKIIPPEEGNDLCHRFVHHGRAVCIARRPQCQVCCLRDICRHGKTVE